MLRNAADTYAPETCLRSLVNGNEKSEHLRITTQNYTQSVMEDFRTLISYLTLEKRSNLPIVETLPILVTYVFQQAQISG